MSITAEFIQHEVEDQLYEISYHADEERLHDKLLISQVEYVLLHCTILEDYPDDVRGESCLALGFTQESIPVHVVCGKNTDGHLFIITTYIPGLPKWHDPFTRNR